MKTYELKKEEIIRKWHFLDATDQVMGRLACKVARLLIGKNKVQYTPHVDGGDHVIVLNCKKVRITGHKKETKTYHHHSGYIGGLKKVTYEQMLEKHPGRILEHAVQRMLPKTKIGKRMFSRLRAYEGEAHPHQAQQPKKATH
ncbi:MAG: 50S ribosomal protein L13 [Candidatus Aureabacteria bacterium]|nr:50S ribosomal protein L13 [Candidatus Auribacterota bacterium]